MAHPARRRAPSRPPAARRHDKWERPSLAARRRVVRRTALRQARCMGSAERQSGAREEAEFRTDRLRVRRWRAADEPALLAVYGDKSVVR